MKELYCDESRQDLLSNKSIITPFNRYIFIGGIMFNKKERDSLKNALNELKTSYGINSKCELKWNRVTSRYLDLYKKLIDIYIDNNIDFRAICIDATKVDLHKFHSDNSELGFYKFYYQLLNNWLECGQKYMIYTDIKTNKNPFVLNTLKKCLNNKKKEDAVDRIYAIESHESVFLQLEDVIMGAVAYKRNFAYNGRSKAKTELVKYLEKRLGGPIKATTKTAVKFNLFEIRI